MARMRTALVVAAVAAIGLVGLAPGAASADPPQGPHVLLVGSYRGRPGTYPDIQAAVDAARPGDWVLIGPGDYHERADYREDGRADEAGGAVLVTTPGIHLRGMDRNAVVVDGTRPGAPRCSAAPADQDLGPRDASARPVGRNGVFVSKVDGVSVENLTACNFLDGNGGGNQIWFNGGDGSGTIGMGSYHGAYLTATSTYFETSHRQAEYGIFVSNARGPGSIDRTYASNMADSSYYIGACPDCRSVLSRAHGQNSALGYSGTNSGGRLVISGSEFDHNKTGISTNSQNNDDAPSPQDGICPSAVPGTRPLDSCTFFIGNSIHDNNNPNVPASGSADLGPVGTGMVIAGGRHDTVVLNRFERNGAWAMLTVPFPDTDANPPPVADCRGGDLDPGGLLGGLGVKCYFDDFANEIAYNAFSGNGFFGNETNGDLADLSGQHDVGNCWHHDVDRAGLTTAPADLATTHATCGVPNAGADLLSPLSAQVICDTEAFGPCATTPTMNYPRLTTVRLASLSPQPSMPNPCADVPNSAWCRGGHVRR
jgi:hypothetical protein